MANLDTRSKRASSVGILSPFILAPVLPDGSISQADRQHIALSYSGILAEALAAIQGLITVAFTSRKPGVAFTSRKPGITFTGEG